MRTNLDIDSTLIESVVEATGEKTKSKAVTMALQEYIRRTKIDGLRTIAGRLFLEDTRGAARGRPA